MEENRERDEEESVGTTGESDEKDAADEGVLDANGTKSYRRVWREVLEENGTVSRISGEGGAARGFLLLREGGDDASSADRVEDFCVEDEVLFRERWVFVSYFEDVEGDRKWKRGCGRHR